MSYNHESCSVAWSPDSATFVQLVAEKWSYTPCRAGRIAEGPRLAGTVDLGEAAEKNAFAFLKAQKNSAFRRHGTELETAMDLGSITNEGIINLSLGGQLRGSEAPDDRFELSERFRLRGTPTGLQIEALDVRYLSNR